MRLTAVVNSMHIGNTFKQIWKVQHKRKVLDYGVREKIESKGRQVVDALELLNLKRVVPSTLPIFPENKDGIPDPSLIPKPIAQDNSHPDWHVEQCRVYHDHSSLLAGLDEGLHVAKACLVANSLPDKIQSLRSTVADEVHHSVQQAILNAHVLDALQVKLPLPLNRVKPGFRLPRSYGLPRWRRNSQLLHKIFQIVDTTLVNQDVDVAQYHFNSEFTTRAPLILDGKPVLFESFQNNVILGRKPMPPYVDGETRAQLLSKPLPSIYPLSRTISIHGRNIYRLESNFPVRQGAPLDRLTMAIFFINRPFMKYTGTQQQSRLLLHSFGVASAYAQQRYGKDVKELPEPVTINCLQTDSQHFYFGCLQLHSLDLDSSQAANNLFWAEDAKPMFTKCDYVNGQPVLEGYNPEVIEILLALYKSQIVA